MFTDLVKEVHLTLNRQSLKKTVDVPTQKTIKEILKIYEDLIILYLTTDHEVRTRIGKWYIIKKTFRHLFGKAIHPVTKYLPQITFSKKIKDVIEASTEQLDYLRDTHKIKSASQDHYQAVEWELKDPQRDLT